VSAAHVGSTATSVVHLLSGLRIGGKERAALRLAQYGRGQGFRHELVLHDTPFRSTELDFTPGDIPVHFLRRGRGIDLQFAWRLGRLFGALHADVVHAHNDSALFYAVLGALVPGSGHPRVVTTLHTLPMARSLRSRPLVWLAGKQSYVVAVSEELRDQLFGSGWLSSCGTVWNGVDLDAFRPDGPSAGWREQLGVGSAEVLVGHIGRFDPVKRHIDLVEAAKLLRVRMPTLHFVLVGQGNLQTEIRERAAALPNVHFVPNVTDMPALFRALDIFVLCSAHEGTPLALLEAMASGVRCVATAVGGVPHVLGLGTDEETAGVLVPPLTPWALAEAIGRLAGAPSERHRLALAARRRAHAFSLASEWNSYCALYEDAGGSTAYRRRLGRCF
jgi:L-malate glycosyltransferase